MLEPVLLTVGWLVQTLDGEPVMHRLETPVSRDLSSAEPRYHKLHHGFYFHRLSSSDDIITPSVVASGSPPLAFSEVEVVSKGDGVRGQR